jgi:hypothetical protein
VDDPAEALFAVPAERAPRSTVFAATAENLPACGSYGLAHRLWGVPVGLHLDADKLVAWRDQLWAEAVSEYRKGSSWTLSPAEEERRGGVQGELSAPDEWEQQVLAFMKEHDQPRIEEILDDLFPPEVEIEGYDLEELSVSSDGDALVHREWTKPDEMRVGAILRDLGYAPVRMRKDGLRHIVWVAVTQTPPAQAAGMAGKQKKARK